VRDLARIGPTSIVFGVWDSRASQAKLPRLVKSTIYATDISPRRRSAQYFPTIDYKKEAAFAEQELSEAEEEARKGNRGDLAELGYVAVPATNSHGGVVVRGEIVRDCTINLVALRRLGTVHDLDLRRYLLGLALVAATMEQDYFLRSGCQLYCDPDTPPVTRVVFRRGQPGTVTIEPNDAISYARKRAEDFKVPPGRQIKFDKKFAEEDRERWSKTKNKGQKEKKSGTGT
jgi:CRISPR-associated protein Csb1